MWVIYYGNNYLNVPDIPMKKRILTWIKPTSNQLHLGNYFGAVKPLFDLVRENPDAEVFFMLASMHALTKVHDWQEMHDNSLAVVRLYLAMMRAEWFKDDDLLIFNPPVISGHAELTWVFQCLTHMWFMERMHAYKDAASKGKWSEVSVWLFCYPILMAIDIIIYDTDYVPVGKDQKQHVEYARDIAQKFNHHYGETFKLPQPMIRPDVATIPWTDWRKMSKSYNNFIWLLDDEATIRKKIARIPTAAIGIEDPKNPDEDNVYNIHKLFLNEEENEALRQRYLQWWLSYKDAKQWLADTVRAFVQPIQAEYAKTTNEEVIALLDKNAKVCNEIGKAKVADVYKKVGFTLHA